MMRTMQRPVLRAIFGSLMLLCLARPAAAGEPIDTEGPDFTDSAQVVPKGRFQVEVSPTWSRGRDDGTTISTPTLLRYGLSEAWEVRIAPEGYVREGDARGMGDTAIGMKW